MCCFLTLSTHSHAPFPAHRPICCIHQVFEYLEMEDRIEVLNARLAVLHELLDMLRLQVRCLLLLLLRG